MWGGCTIIGYARKSIGINDEAHRKRLSNSMLQCLKERSLCDMVFVSWSCSAAADFTSRDTNDNTDLLNELVGVDGNTQCKAYYICKHVNDYQQLIFFLAMMLHIDQNQFKVPKKSKYST